jgi:hypothetical protein
VAIQEHLKTYSIVDLKVAPVTGDTPGTLVDLPGIRELTLTFGTELAELRGDNAVLAIVDNGRTAEWSMESGGLSFDAMEVITGKTMTESGTTPAVVRRLEFASDDQSPYFTIVGKSNSDDGAQDLHVVIYKAKATDDMEFTLTDGEFLTPTFGGAAVGRTSDKVIAELVQHETATAPVVPTP